MSAIPRVTQLSGLVWRILGCNPGPMTLQGTNLYLVGNGTKRILIDAGQNGFPECVENLNNLLAEQKTSIDKILITHWHEDHIGGLKDMRKAVFKSECPVVYKFKRLEVPDNPLPEGYLLEQLKDNQILKTDGASLRVLYTPGHTTDHAAVSLEEEKAIFSGDCILGEGTTVFEDLHDYMKSLERILAEQPTVIYPGHGPVVPDPKETIQYYLDHRREREVQILEIIRQAGRPVTPGEIVKVAYQDTPPFLHAAAEYNVRHHLDKLIKEKRVRRRSESYFVEEQGKL
jgi:ribonuclease/clavin/mitogillin